MYETYIDQMSENFQGELQSVNYPCIRSTLDDCDNALEDKCWDYCCPAGYYCARSPIVGLYCQEGSVTCGDHNWCRDFADIPRTCATEVCKNHHMVKRVTTWSYVLAAMGIVFDLVDVVVMFTLPDKVICKSGVNIFSSLVKMLGFCAIMGAGTQRFMTELLDSQCFNGEGMQLASDAGDVFRAYAIMQVLSAVFGLLLSPFSAYYGGQLSGVPYVK